MFNFKIERCMKVSECVRFGESSQTEYIYVNSTQTAISCHSPCVAAPKVTNALSNSRQPPPHLIIVYIH